MSTLPQGRPEGLRMYDELIAVHTIMRRGAALTASALHRLADGTKLDVTALVRVARWQAEFVDHHHRSEDELFWPVLRRLFPEAVASLDALTLEHEALHVELENLSSAIDAIEATSDGGADAHAAAVKLAVTEALPAAEKVRDVLISHLGTEEPVLQRLFPQVPDADIVRLRKAIIAGAPRSGPDLVIGLLEDPSPAPGYASMMASFPPPIRWLRPILRRRYLARKKALQQ